jgi:hypothetical protein
MAAQTIKAQVEELAGSTSIASLDDWAGDAVNKLVLILPYNRLFPFSTTESVVYSGTYTELTTKNKRIFEITRSPSNGSVLNRVCTMISPEDYRGQYADPNSMYYPTDYDPKCTLYGDIVRVLPQNAGMVVVIRKIDLVDTLDTTSTSISILPYECEYLVILDVAQRVALNKMISLMPAVLTSSAVAPTSPTLTTVSYVNATGSTVTPVTVGTIPVAPTYTNVTVPSGIATVLSLFDTAVTYDTMSVTTIAGLTLVTTAPTIAVGFTNALSAFDTAMTSEDIELATAQINKAADYLKQFESDIALYNQKVEAEYKTYQASTGKSLEVVKAKVLVNTEIPKTFLAKANTYIQQYQTQVQESLTSFNKDLKKFESDVQKVLDQAKLTEQEAGENAKLATDVAMQNAIQTAEAILKNNSSLLQKYQSDVGNYAQKIQAEVSVYQLNIQRVSIERDRLLALINSFKQEYYELLAIKFGINIKGNKSEK